jgi:hypothetical protein
MTATAQNIKRMVKLLSRKGPKAAVSVAQKPLENSFITGLLRIFVWLSQNINKKLFGGENYLVET